MPRYKLTVAYDGTRFHGWQKQGRRAADGPAAASSSGAGEDVTNVPHEVDQGRELLSERPRAAAGADDTDEGSSDALRTVQASLERAVRRVIGEPVIVLGASRTDSGVHARGQVAAFTTVRPVRLEMLPRAISSRLPDDVRVIRAELVDDAFDPISDAVAKGYRYRVAFGCRPHEMPLFSRQYVARYPHALDAARMNLAARLMIGEHDFASFARISHGRLSTVRVIHECKVVCTSARRLHLDIAGSGFLYNMVRIIMGTLVEVGRGRIEPEAIPEIIAAKDRRAAGPTMPPTGLCLMWIRYPEASSPAGDPSNEASPGP